MYENQWWDWFFPSNTRTRVGLLKIKNIILSIDGSPLSFPRTSFHLIKKNEFQWCNYNENQKVNLISPYTGTCCKYIFSFENWNENVTSVQPKFEKAVLCTLKNQPYPWRWWLLFPSITKSNNNHFSLCSQFDGYNIVYSRYSASPSKFQHFNFEKLTICTCIDIVVEAAFISSFVSSSLSSASVQLLILMQVSL